jgi:hypothetical protein
VRVMSTLSKMAEFAVLAIVEILRGIPKSQRQRVLDTARERMLYDAAGDRKLAQRRANARKKVLK